MYENNQHERKMTLTYGIMQKNLNLSSGPKKLVQETVLSISFESVSYCQILMINFNIFGNILFLKVILLNWPLVWWLSEGP